MWQKAMSKFFQTYLIGIEEDTIDNVANKSLMAGLAIPWFLNECWTLWDYKTSNAKSQMGLI